MNQKRLRTTWKVGIATLVGTDTLTTGMALKTGEAIEVNPVMSGLIEQHGFIGLLLMKAVVITAAYLVWEWDDCVDTTLRKITHVAVPSFAAATGVLLTISNSIFIILITA